jgi:hypothetical protein
MFYLITNLDHLLNDIPAFQIRNKETEKIIAIFSKKIDAIEYLNFITLKK